MTRSEIGQTTNVLLTSVLSEALPRRATALYDLRLT